MKLFKNASIVLLVALATVVSNSYHAEIIGNAPRVITSMVLASGCASLVFTIANICLRYGHAVKSTTSCRAFVNIMKTILQNRIAAILALVVQLIIVILSVDMLVWTVNCKGNIGLCATCGAAQNAQVNAAQNAQVNAAQGPQGGAAQGPQGGAAGSGAKPAGN